MKYTLSLPILCLNILSQCDSFHTYLSVILQYYKSSECQAIDRIGNRNLKPLYSKTDKTLILDPNTQLLYNLCGPLRMSCNNFWNVSFCLKTRNLETVLGWQTHDVISENGLLRMEFTGDRCLNQRSFAEVTVHFACNYANSSAPEIYVVLYKSYQLLILNRRIKLIDFKCCQFSPLCRY